MNEPDLKKRDCEKGEPHPPHYFTMRGYPWDTFYCEGQAAEGAADLEWTAKTVNDIAMQHMDEWEADNAIALAHNAALQRAVLQAQQETATLERERYRAQLVLAKHLLRRFVRCDTTGLKDPLVIEAQAFLKEGKP